MSYHRAPRAPSRVDQCEADTVAAILQYLAHRGYHAWLTHDARHKPIPRYAGIPDIMGVSPLGQFVAIEVKAEDGVVSERQEDFHRELFRRRVRVIVARSLDEVIGAGV